MRVKHRGDTGEYEFTRASYDELRDAERRYQVAVDLSLLPSPQRGVWHLVLSARAKGEHEVMSLVSRYQADWPNSVAVSFAAFQYACCHRLVRMVEAWHAAREEEERDRRPRG